METHGREEGRAVESLLTSKTEGYIMVSYKHSFFNFNETGKANNIKRQERTFAPEAVFVYRERIQAYFS